MKTIKRATAAILAAVSTAAMAASMAPVFAYEDQGIAKEDFVNSFNEGIDRKCAQYLIDNGCALDEAKGIMDTYIEGLAMMEEQPMARAASAGHYYSNTSLAPTEHFVLVIATTPDNPIEMASIKVSAKNSHIATTADSISPMFGYDKNADVFSTTFKGAGTNWRHTIDLEGVKAFSSSTARSVARIEIAPISSYINTEANLYNTISMSVDMAEEEAIADDVFAYETYAKGDVNHDGLVNKADSTLLLQFLAESSTLDIKYADGSNHYSFVTNVAAADFNLDGSVSMIDIVKLDQYLAAN